MPRDGPVTTATFPLRSNSDTVVPSPFCADGRFALLHMIYLARELIGRNTTRQVEDVEEVEEDTRDGRHQCRNRPDP
jgi:hypothetical protein